MLASTAPARTRSLKKDGSPPSIEDTMGGMSGVRLVIQFTADSVEAADKAIADAAERCKRVQQEPGCLQFEVFRSALQPEKYVLLEHWESKEALAEHAKLMAANPPPQNPRIKRVREDYEHQAS
jgi:quinol monooxygenase YgiN